MPLIFEIWDNRKNAWVEINQLIPGDPPASISNHSLIGGREMLLIECRSDDSESIIARSPRGVDVELPGGLRSTLAYQGLHIIKELQNGDKFEVHLMKDRMVAPQQFRLRHVTVDFGTRKCPICEQEIPAQRFGSHVIEEHAIEQMAQLPGGATQILSHLRQSVNESIKRAEGFPRVQDRLRLSLKLINSYEKYLKANLN